MKQRFKRYLLYLFTQYIPGTNKLAKAEAKMLGRYVFDNFSNQDRVNILTEMESHLIDLIKSEIKAKENEIEKQQIELNLLIKTLAKLNQK